MNPVMEWAIGLAVAVLLPLVGYLLAGMRIWGRVEEQLKTLNKQMEDNTRETKELRAEMTKLQVDVMREVLGRRRSDAS